MTTSAPAKKAGRMVYVAAVPANEPGTMASESDELAEVRWVSLGDAEGLMGAAIGQPVSGISGMCLMHPECAPRGSCLPRALRRMIRV